MRRFLFWMVSGALSGVVIATLVAPWARLMQNPETPDGVNHPFNGDILDGVRLQNF